MRFRVVSCADESHPLGWVNAIECTHWSMTCPRAKKAKKSDHKLRQSAPGFPIHVHKPTHRYDPDLIASTEFTEHLSHWHWEDVPSQMRYANCLCGAPWHQHLPWFETGDYYYHGMLSPTPQGTPYVRIPQAANVFTCTTGCGFEGVT